MLEIAGIQREKNEDAAEILSKIAQLAGITNFNMDQTDAHQTSKKWLQ